MEDQQMDFYQIWIIKWEEVILKKMKQWMKEGRKGGKKSVNLEFCSQLIIQGWWKK